MTEAFDTDFAAAVRRAAMGDGAALAAILLSDRPLGTGEREQLAQLVEGEISRSHGRQPVGLWSPEVAAAILRYRELLKAGKVRKAALSITAEEAERSEKWLRGWISDFNKRIKNLPETDAKLLNDRYGL